MKPSFANTLKSFSIPFHAGKYYDLFTVEDYFVNVDEQGIKVKLKTGSHIEASAPWEDGLILKVVGGNHSYSYLHARLSKKWSPKCNWQLIDLPNNFYLERFVSEEDQNFALTGGTWMIGGSYLVIQKWKPFFDANDDNIQSMAVWVRFAKLPLESSLRNSSLTLGTILGRPLKWIPIPCNKLGQSSLECMFRLIWAKH